MSATETADTGNVEELSFGSAMERLEAIVAQLEGDEALDLEQALALYERGVKLAITCRGRLARAELRLSEIAATAADEDPAAG